MRKVVEKMRRCDILYSTSNRCDEKERNDKMNQWKEKLQRFMYGRYGMDAYGNFIFTAVFVLIIVNVFVHTFVLSCMEIALIGYGYFRVLSKDHATRYRENAKFLEWKNKWSGIWKKNPYHIYSCPNCKQKIRIPKGKGKIEITCPKCKTTFRKRS